MDSPRDYHTKWCKSGRERQIPYGITYMWNLKYDTNELIYPPEQKQTHIQRRLVGGGGGAGVDWEFGMCRCKVLHIENKQRGPTL